MSGGPNIARRDSLRMIFALTTVAAAYFAFRVATQQHQLGLTSDTAKIFIWVPVCLIAGLTAAGGLVRLPQQIGLGGTRLSDILPGLVAAVVMALVLGVHGGRHIGAPSTDTILFRTITGPITEELLFRGFLISQLLLAGFGRWRAVLIAAAMFGAAHIPNTEVWGSGDTAIIAGTFAITGAGGLLFGLVMLMARGSVLAAMAFHVGLNFVWELFAVGQIAIGDGEANLARAAAVLAGLFVAVVLARRHRTSTT